MSINYEKILKSNQEYIKDLELLKDIEYNEILFIISKEIVKYREENNLKQQDLAQKLKITQEMVSKMESGKYNHTIKSLVNLWNNLSNDTFNFGAELLRKIYDRVIKNYNTIYFEMKKEIPMQEFEFKGEMQKIKIDFDENAGTSINRIFNIAC